MSFSETPSAATLRLLLEKAEREQLDQSIVDRLRVILFFADNDQSMTQTCRVFGISRSTLHRWIDRFDADNLSTLQDRSHEAFSLRQPVVSSEARELIRRYRMRYTQMGKEKISELLSLDYGIELSPSTVARVIERECFYFADTPSHWKKRVALQKNYTHDPATHQSLESSSILGSNDDELSSERSVEILPRRRFRFVRFILITSVMINIVVLSALLGIAVFEMSVSSVPLKPDMQAINTPQMLHTAPITVPLP